MDRGRHHRYQNSETQNGARFGGGHGGGRDRNNGDGGGGRGGNGSNTNPPPTNMDRKIGVADRTDAKEVGRSRRDDGLRGVGKTMWGQPLEPTGEGGASHLAPTEEGETSVGPAHLHQKNIRLSVKRQ